MTQHELITEYIKEHGSILPAKLGGVIYMDAMFGSETTKRCRELRAKGVLRSEKDGKFERFFLKEDNPTEEIEYSEEEYQRLCTKYIKNSFVLPITLIDNCLRNLENIKKEEALLVAKKELFSILSGMYK